MKTFFALAGTCIFLLLGPARAFAQLSEPFDNYVVIGAFAIEKNAIRFTKEANAQHLEARFDMNRSRNLYYVYVMNTDDHQRAVDEALRLRSMTNYRDTWVYCNSAQKDIHVMSDSTSGQDNSQPTVATTATETTALATAGNDVVTDTPQALTTSSGETLNAPSNDQVVRTADRTSSNTKTAGSEVEGKKFLFRVTRAVDNKDVAADVDLIDIEKTKKIAAYKGNVPVTVSLPAKSSGKISAVCELFGYRKVTRTFDYNAPEMEGLVADADGNFVVPFELVRLQKGDIAVMYNVYFFKDAGVMRPESKFEVNNLLEMLRENPEYKIKIHGHTNGNSHGRILSMGEDRNFFSLTGTREGFGSAKKLSFERASVIRDYLVSSGIAEDRMTIKAWGGRRPIHDKHHARAAENVRVEVEILED